MGVGVAVEGAAALQLTAGRAERGGRPAVVVFASLTVNGAWEFGDRSRKKTKNTTHFTH